LGSGLYFHIPFCRSRCSYCHFTRRPFHRATVDRYEKALLQELENFIASGNNPGDVDSIYFGGGTPSLVRAQLIAEISRLCRNLFTLAEDSEITLEANPGTLSRSKVAAYKKCGVSRISVGAQSFSQQELAEIGRIHSPETIIDSCHLLKEGGFENINLDLMLGLPYQTRQSWKRNLEHVAGLGIPHLSIYMLDLDEPCLLKTRAEDGYVTLPEDDFVSDLYLETLEFLAGCGYRQYEISNFALPGFECRHNLKYWKRVPVLGFGLGSHSFDGHNRWANTAQMDGYLESVEAGQRPQAWMELIDAAHALQEELFLGLRLTEGIDLEALRNEYGQESVGKYEAILQDCVRRGLLEQTAGRMQLNTSGMLISNEIFQQFV
jgi:oxygen-independent coproporphyrinogen-3 oxidase